MPASWINTFREIRDRERLDAYLALAGGIYGGPRRPVPRPWAPARAYEQGIVERTTLIEFPSVEAAIGAYESDEYQSALRALGDGALRDIRIIAAT